MRFRTASFRGMAAAAVFLFGAHDFTLAGVISATVVRDNISDFDVTWSGAFPSGSPNSLATPTMTNWEVGPISAINLNLVGGSWTGSITGQHLVNPHPSPEIALGGQMVYNISFPDSSIGSADSGWHSIHHEAIPHDDWYRLTYNYDNIQNTFSAEFQGFHAPEIDPGRLHHISNTDKDFQKVVLVPSR